MKRIVKWALLCAFSVFICAVLISCKKEPWPDTDPDISAVPSGFDDPEGPSVSKYELPNNDTSVTKLGYYSVDSSGRIIRATSLVSESKEITPELIIGYVTDSLEDESIVLKVDSISIEGKTCVISFDDSIRTVASEGIKLETAVLDAISQSILDNIDSVDAMCFRINNEAYSTTNLKFSIDSVYMER